ncbi:MAG TPA: nucleotide sugar dehydrogenase [Sediminibacterium sp.]|uniref:nucleotide sugar dehydrogenase n=1 Tax=Sediminibacterium sp. TaxID=1917865 RepID=UPI0008BAC7DF|nr:nucleotide sugar dehydrogenase [Sediminibacterium sp.]OHC84523.1 MAG: Vi polysaccharide biosynthesis protein VipA/TviB [Sphingobacteriia bacterium RIFOXYC2_FULL_35_18]OHC89036.1 MAG: Vi polysaccharide biosynthesis protein VipA/TviB [Sphingobacteriia bacterium RIFOXYD2_FULL_35_12]HLD53098.1 nucleotide sugar dehydrogenase [Sediminibacterium sp.]
MEKETKIGILGLGYVGLPLSLAFASKYNVIGYDINSYRVEQLKKFIDSTNEIEFSYFETKYPLCFTNNLKDIQKCNVFIITVPTPLSQNKEPDLSFLKKASSDVGSVLKKGDLVIYESTVYPGCTEEECVPVLIASSGLVFNIDFFVGYSPERINPGDKERPLQTIVKVTSGSTPEIAIVVDELYKSIITAGTYMAKSMKVAEASKAIENAQRDVNISFMNELALMFDKMEIDINEVLEAAKTKWNFLPFKPGLVGGHCIGVDPYYLAYKAIQVGYTPKVILSGREVNDQMGVWMGEKIIAHLAKQFNGAIRGKRVLILGFAFKENCADIRNTKVIDVYNILKAAGLNVQIFDPLVDPILVKKTFNLELKKSKEGDFDYIFKAVNHTIFNS